MCPLILWVHVIPIAEQLSIYLHRRGITCTCSIFTRILKSVHFFEVYEVQLNQKLPSYTLETTQKKIKKLSTEPEDPYDLQC